MTPWFILGAVGLLLGAVKIWLVERRRREDLIIQAYSAWFAAATNLLIRTHEDEEEVASYLAAEGKVILLGDVDVVDAVRRFRNFVLRRGGDRDGRLVAFSEVGDLMRARFARFNGFGSTDSRRVRGSFTDRKEESVDDDRAGATTT